MSTYTAALASLTSGQITAIINSVDALIQSVSSLDDSVAMAISLRRMARTMQKLEDVIPELASVSGSNIGTIFPLTKVYYRPLSAGWQQSTSMIRMSTMDLTIINTINDITKVLQVLDDAAVSFDEGVNTLADEELDATAYMSGKTCIEYYHTLLRRSKVITADMGENISLATTALITFKINLQQEVSERGI